MGASKRARGVQLIDRYSFPWKCYIVVGDLGEHGARAPTVEAARAVALDRDCQIACTNMCNEPGKKEILLGQQEVGGSIPLGPRMSFLLTLFILFASCTPAPKYCVKRGEAQRDIERPAGAEGDSMLSALRIAPPVKQFAPSRITSPFGARNDPRHGGRAFHEGVDIKAGAGEEIIAAAAGTVVLSGRQRGYGNVVIIDHGGGVRTLYAHLFYASVRKGERVSAGQTVGHAGKRGSATGTHLHFEMRLHGRALDPVPHLWLDSGNR
jgi:hypothetical protein